MTFTAERTNDPDRAVAVVTGASSGIGAEFAEQLARRGAELVLVARDEERLTASSRRLADHGSPRVTPIALDLSEPGAAGRLVAELRERGIVPTMLVNNAGFGTTRPFATTEPEALSRQVALNVTAVVELTRALLPGLVAAGGGTLVNVASLSAYQPLPQMAVYAASKAFVLHFTEALSAELAGSGVKVLAISPGPTRSGFYAASGTDEAGVRFQTPEQVVAVALSALDARRTPASVIAGRANRAQVAVGRLLPRGLLLRLASRSVRASA